jgi:prepilin-type N-terminal cleavage/methylation domain-containing protein|tara:strand:+ start:232 stop:660 length:429 start_codon:yes stop_codon:yes gene_type:complete
MNVKSKAAGFTLIEVLIAATILFTVVAAVSQVYQGATKASMSASRSVEVSALVPLLADTISFHLRQADVSRPISQQGILNDYQFSWTASVIRRGSPPAKFEFETDSYTTFDEKFYLWQVELQLTKDSYSQQFEFTTLSWKGL